jgi:hypothetical protein
LLQQIATGPGNPSDVVAFWPAVFYFFLFWQKKNESGTPSEKIYNRNELKSQQCLERGTTRKQTLSRCQIIQSIAELGR